MLVCYSLTPTVVGEGIHCLDNSAPSPFARFPLQTSRDASYLNKPLYAMSSSLPTVLPAEIDQTTDLAHHCDVYTNALAQNDRLLSSDLSSDLSRPQLQALVSDESTMSQGHIAMWQLAEVGYEDVPAESYRDDFSDIEACSWEDALQAIDEYDWSFTEQGHEHEFPGDSA